MDLLTHILKVSGLQKRLFRRSEVNEDSTLKFPCEKSIGFHVVTKDEMYLWEDNLDQPKKLKEGDIAFMARGVHHKISLQPKIKGNVRSIKSESENDLVNPKSKSPFELNFISAAFQFWHDPIHPVFQFLPNWKVIPTASMPSDTPLKTYCNLLIREVSKPQLGTEAIVNHLVDILFHLIFRELVPSAYHHKLEAFENAQDYSILQALKLIHFESEKSWKVETLAKAVGLSRSNFSDKFKSSTGKSPLQYLTIIRVMKGIQLLMHSSQTIESIASQVGYADGFSFSKVFKKLMGVSPIRFRQQDHQDSLSPWRIYSN